MFAPRWHTSHLVLMPGAILIVAVLVAVTARAPAHRPPHPVRVPPLLPLLRPSASVNWRGPHHRGARRPTRGAVRAPALDRRVASEVGSIQRPAPASQAPILVRVVDVSDAAHGQAAVDRCAGPVEVLYSPYDLPNDIVQHDYCGGAWFATLSRGTRIRIIGGTQPGLYEVNGRRRTVPKGMKVYFLRNLGSLVLQTCRGDDLVATGLTRITS